MRYFKENFIVRYAGNYLMINLVSFRRKIISNDDYVLLKNIAVKNYENLFDIEKNYMQKLYNEKQLLSNDIISMYDKQRESSSCKPYFNIGSITINLTYNCNFKCNYCYQRDFEHNGQYLTVNDIDRISDYINDYNALHNTASNVQDVVISGGESLLECNIDTINYICSKFKGSKIKLFTNGTNIMQFADRVDFTKFSEIQVSFDGVDEVIESINNNKKYTFNNIADGILFLLNKKVKVTIISMVAKESLPFLNKFLKLLEEKNILNNDLVALRLSFVVNYNEKYTLEQNFYSAEEYLDIRQKVINIVNGKKNVAVDRLYDLSFFARVIYREQNDRTEGRISMCKVEKGFPLLFSPDHGVYWCTCTDLGKRLSSFDNPPEELDKSPLFNELINRNIYKIDQCKNCLFRFVCSSGCPLYAIQRNDGCANVGHCGIFNHPLFEEQAELFLGN